MTNKAVARHTEIEALLPNPDPMGIALLNRKETSPVGGLANEM